MAILLKHRLLVKNKINQSICNYVVILGDNGVIKSIVKESESYETPGYKDMVVIKYKAMEANSKKIISESESTEFELGSGFMCPGFKVAVHKMK